MCKFTTNIKMDHVVFKTTSHVNLAEIEKFLESLPPPQPNHNNVSTILPFMTYHILAFQNEILLGWLALIEANPTMLVIYDWHPLVSPSSEALQLKIQLVQEAQKIVLERSRSSAHKLSLRAFVQVDETQENQLKTLENLYFSLGMTKSHVCYCMKHTIQMHKIQSVEIPAEYEVSNLTAETQKDLQKAYDLMFQDSLDDFVNSLDEDERKEWDLLGSDFVSDASLVLKQRNRIVGMVGVRNEGNFAEFGPVGILKEHRKKGLAKLLMRLAFSQLLVMGQKNVYLEVGIRNTPAFNLYASFGFRVFAQKHGYIYRVDNDDVFV